MELKNKTQRLIKILIEKKIKICCAESVSGGKFAYEIIRYKNASKIFDYGVVVYSKHSKIRILNLKNQLNKHNIVSKEIAESMVREVIKFSKSKKILGISCTGQAGPGYLNRKIKIGTVFIGISFGKKVFSVKKEFNIRSRTSIIDATVNEMIEESLKTII